MCINLVFNRRRCLVIITIADCARASSITAAGGAIAVVDLVSLNQVWLQRSSTATACTRSWLLLGTCYVVALYYL